ncbi:MAG: plastocyanin/azurin family copper-binding protein [Balneolales bacterium]
MYHYTIFILASLLFVVISCGEEEVQPLEFAELDENNVQLVRLRSAGNEMLFDRDLIRVRPDLPVRIILINSATMNVMKHNFLIVNSSSVEEVGQAALDAAETGYVPDTPDVLLASELTDPGETIEFEFMPPEVGTYEFVCTYPGHYTTMRGMFLVEEEVEE